MEPDEPKKRASLGEIVAIGAAMLGLIMAVVWPLWWWIGGSSSTPISVSPQSPSHATPSSPSPPNPMPVAAAPASSNIVPAPLDPILIADSQNDPLHTPAIAFIPADVHVPGEDYTPNVEESRRYITSLCQDLKGSLWEGTEAAGVYRFTPSSQEWTQFTVANGLGDDYIYAVACDRKGRIWVGHLNHGVSVFNGIRWQNYEVIGGLSRPDSRSGPLGERVFAIKVNPADGDVWIATSAGLSRYSESKDTWTYFTTAEGLPSNQANAIAFDATGNIYLATQCDGIAMAKSSDNYQHWTYVIGSDAEPLAPSGDGLPTNLMNYILVARDDTIYAATTAGLA